MKIDFSILWFDDESDWFESLNKETITESLKSLGFEVEFRFVSSAEEFEESKQSKQFKEFHLLVIDYNLSGEDKAAPFIKDLKHHNIHADVILYSSSSLNEIWEHVAGNQLDSIYVSTRGNIVDKTTTVCKHIISKFLDLDAMRGIAMAELAELDKVQEQLIHNLIESSEEHKEKIYKHFLDLIKESFQECNDKLSSFEKEPSLKSMFKLCDSSKRWSIFTECASLRNIKLANRDFRNDILGPRNRLAHRTDPELSQESLLELRKKILEYREFLQQTMKNLS